jgi:hypothetical protein
MPRKPRPVIEPFITAVLDICTLRFDGRELLGFTWK